MILDLAPNEDGRIVLDPGPVDSFVAHVLKSGEAPLAGRERFTDHHATCSKASLFRKKPERRKDGGT